MNGQISLLTTNNTNLTSQLETANGQITTLNAQITALNAQITTLTNSNNSLTTDNASLNTQLATANATITTLNGQVSSLQTQLDTANTTNTSLTTQLSNATGSIATLNAQVTSLTAQLTAANSTINDRDATIVTLNSTITSLQGQISSMVATPVPMSASTLSATVSTNITVTATFPASENGKNATFSATGGTLDATNVVIAGGTASTTFRSAATGTFNIYAVQGMYAGGAIVAITAAPATTYSISGTISLNGTGQSGVTVALTGAATNAAITAIDGTYSFSGLQNGSYTLTPNKSGYSFKPATISVTVNNANVTGQNFTDIITQTYQCTGTLSEGGRWCDNNNGTIRDMTTGLIWLKKARCGPEISWVDAENWAAGLANGTSNTTLNDSSAAGSWRLPTKEELVAIKTGTEQVRSTTPRLFTNVQADFYWSSSTEAGNITYASTVQMYSGIVINSAKTHLYFVWPVRGGQ